MDQPLHQLKIARIEMMWLVKLHLKIYPWMIMMIMGIKNITFHRGHWVKHGLEWNGMEWNGMDWNGMEWIGLDWNGMEWNGMEL